MMCGKNSYLSAHPGRRRAGSPRTKGLLLKSSITALWPLLLITPGCYTRFAEFEPVSVKAAADTVAPQDSEICIWERDLTGYPRLRCYPSYYPRQWYLYNYSPWWYHNSSHLYNSEKCPPYYYYDDNCGCCRYYLNNPDLVRSGKDGVVRKNADTAAAQDSNRVSITVSSGTSVFIPLKGTTAPAAPDARPAAGQPASAQNTTDSLAARQQGDSTAAKQRRDTMTVIPVNRLRRSLRGR
jgi:hypothetical protein